MAGRDQQRLPHAAIAWRVQAAVELGRAGRSAEAERICREILANDPACFDALHLLALLRHKAGHPAEALELIDQALSRDRRSADALTNRATILLRLGRAEEALAACDHALKLDPRHLYALSNRGSAQRTLGRDADALASYEKVLALDPRSAGTWSNHGVLLRALGRHAEALASIERALALEPASPLLRFNDGMLRLAMGDFAGGWEQHEFRPQRAESPWQKSAPQWSGVEPLAGKTILLYAEQGLGDTLQFIRYVPRVAQAAARVWLKIQESLTALQLPLADNVALLGADVPPLDLQCPLMSLPRAFRTEITTIPDGLCVAAPADRVAAWADRLPPRQGTRVGLAWAGNPEQGNDRQRSIPLTQLLPLLAFADADFFSLQRDLRPGDDALLRDHPGLVHLGPALDDFADTAAVISQLDLVITIDSAVAHLAGAMGKPVWILLAFCPDWRWHLDREDSPWYSSARLFRQPAIGDWDSVIDRVGRELRAVEARDANNE
jgi:tetratricopeptide (TPR) repeat protein